MGNAGCPHGFQYDSVALFWPFDSATQRPILFKGTEFHSDTMTIPAMGA